MIVEFFGSFDFDLSPKFQTVGPRRFVKGSGIRVLAKDGKNFLELKLLVTMMGLVTTIWC